MTKTEYYMRNLQVIADLKVTDSVVFNMLENRIEGILRYEDLVPVQETIQGAITALKLQTPTKVLHLDTDDDLVCGICPNCGTPLCYSDAYENSIKFCGECGQKLDWKK